MIQSSCSTRHEIDLPTNKLINLRSYEVLLGRNPTSTNLENDYGFISKKIYFYGLLEEFKAKSLAHIICFNFI